jgi:hypothetical protein
VAERVRQLVEGIVVVRGLNLGNVTT